MAVRQGHPAGRGHLLPFHALELVFQPQGPRHPADPPARRPGQGPAQPGHPAQPQYHHPSDQPRPAAGRHDRHASGELLLPDQHHDLGHALCHPGPGPEHRRGHRRSAGAGLCGLLRRGRLFLRPAQPGVRPGLLGLSARGRLHGHRFRPGPGLPRAAPAR